MNKAGLKRKREPLRNNSNNQKKKQQKIKNNSKEKKQNKNDEDDSEDYDDSDNDSNSDEESDADIDLSDEKKGEEIQQFTFDFNDMKESYFHGIRVLVKTTIDNTNISSSLSDEIVLQDTVGTVITCEGDDDVFAFASILPLESIKKSELFRKLNNHLTALKEKFGKSSNKLLHNLLTNMIDETNDQISLYGGLLHGRFTNLPLQLIYDLHRNIKEDIQWAQTYFKNSKSTNKEEVDEVTIRRFESMKYLIMFCPCSLSDSANPQSSKKNSKSTTSSNQQPTDLVENCLGANYILFENFEDEVYFQAAEEAFLLKNLSTDLMKHSMNVMLVIPVEKYNSIVSSLVNLLGL